MIFKKILLALTAGIFILPFASAEKKTVKDTFSVSFRLNTAIDDGKNSLVWSTSSKKIKDSYDALSGASVMHSTGELFTVIHGSETKSKDLLLPKGLRALLLFACSSPEFLSSDNLEVKEENNRIKITFTHRNVKYFILSDEKHYLDAQKSFFTLTEEAEESKENAQPSDVKQDIPEESTEPEEEISAAPPEDEDSQTKEDPLVVQIQNQGYGQEKANAKSAYSGKLKAILKNNVLTVKGRLYLIENTEGK